MLSIGRKTFDKYAPWFTASIYYHPCKTWIQQGSSQCLYWSESYPRANKGYADLSLDWWSKLPTLCEASYTSTTKYWWCSITVMKAFNHGNSEAKLPTLCEASYTSTLRWWKLLTMATVKHSRRKASQKLKEAQQVSKCLRRRLVFCNHTGQSYDSSSGTVLGLSKSTCRRGGSHRKRLRVTGLINWEAGISRHNVLQ